MKSDSFAHEPEAAKVGEDFQVTNMAPLKGDYRGYISVI